MMPGTSSHCTRGIGSSTLTFWANRVVTVTLHDLCIIDHPWCHTGRPFEARRLSREEPAYDKCLGPASLATSPTDVTLPCARKRSPMYSGFVCFWRRLRRMDVWVLREDGDPCMISNATKTPRSRYVGCRLGRRDVSGAWTNFAHGAGHFDFPPPPLTPAQNSISPPLSGGAPHG